MTSHPGAGPGAGPAAAPPPGPGQEGEGEGERALPGGGQEIPGADDRIPLLPRVVIVASAVPGIFCAGADLKVRVKVP